MDRLRLVKILLLAASFCMISKQLVGFKSCHWSSRLTEPYNILPIGYLNLMKGAFVVDNDDRTPD